MKALVNRSPPFPPSMSRIQRFYANPVGKKLVVAVTGLIWLLFLIGHMAGNLKAFMPNHANGVPALDVYGHFLRTIGEPLVPHSFLLWVARFVLAVSFVLHVVTVILLSIQNRKARPIPYRTYTHRAASIAATSILYTGFAILAFIIIHLLHLTLGWLPFLGKFEHGRVYANAWHSFTFFPTAFVYVVFMAAIGFHLYHGAWSLVQTFGWDHPSRNRQLRMIVMVLAIGLAIGFSVVPLSFALQWQPEPPVYDAKLLGGGE